MVVAFLLGTAFWHIAAPPIGRNDGRTVLELRVRDRWSWQGGLNMVREGLRNLLESDRTMAGKW